VRALVLGSGGREHALCWRLGQDAEVHSAPGNGGIAQEFVCHEVSLADYGAVLELATSLEPSLTVVGPEDPLVAGLADRLRASGLRVVGPGASGAKLEASKAFSKAAMVEAGVPTAPATTCRDAETALDAVCARFDAGRQVAVKASGAALGKGVVVCATREEAEAAVRFMLEDRALGDAGSEVLIEDRLVGREFSLLTLVSGTAFASLPPAQDHKRLGDGDTGPNTGGMGTVSPVPWLDDSLLARTEERVVRPMLEWLAARGVDYRGVLFSGLMVVDGEPYCLEYNVRFGDPETQSVVRRVGDGFWEALAAVAAGEPVVAPVVRPESAVTVVVASGGYPGTYAKGVPISLGPMPSGVRVFHAGTALGPDGLVTSGGRVLGVSAVGANLAAARAAAYAGVAEVRFDGATFRSDI
jgi:phosphoribosylamine---glycine ligase